MSNKNIKQNHFLQVKKILDRVDKSGDNAAHFRAIILMGDAQQSQAYSYIHAPQEDMEHLILEALRNDDTFAYAVAKAIETYVTEQDQEQNESQSKTETDESNHI